MTPSLESQLRGPVVEPPPRTFHADQAVFRLGQRWRRGRDREEYASIRPNDIVVSFEINVLVGLLNVA